MTVGQTSDARMPVPHPAWSEQRRNDDQMADVVALYRVALQRLVGKRTYENFERLLLWSVSDAVVALHRHGIGEEGSCAALAGRHALTQIDQRCGPAGPFKMLPDERAALDELLRVHEQQLRDNRLAPLLLAQAVNNTPQRGGERVERRWRGIVPMRKQASLPESVHG